MLTISHAAVVAAGAAATVAAVNVEWGLHPPDAPIARSEVLVAFDHLWRPVAARAALALERRVHLGSET